MKQTICIAGSGLVGSLLALNLARKGHKVRIYERRADPRESAEEGGRSINLALSDRGWRALEQNGIGEEVRKTAIPMRGRMMHSPDGELTFQPYGTKDQAIYSVSRAELNRLLVSRAAELPGTEYFFEHRCTGVDLAGQIAFFEDKNGNQISDKADLIFGADGAFSAVRSSMQRSDRFNYSQEYIGHGYKELRISPAADGGHRIDKNALHIWPRGGFMLIALPNPDGSFTCTLFLPFEGPESFAVLQSPESVQKFFEKHFSDAVDLIPDLQKDFFAVPAASLVTVRCAPWVYENRIALIGDAAHALVPFYGQGMNAGFEDCRVLSDLLDRFPDRPAEALAEYERKRIPDGHAICSLALKNFTEMRDRVADPAFLVRKKIEARLHEKFGDDWLPQYSIVTFSHTPYSKAQEIGLLQDKIMDDLMRTVDLDNWEKSDWSAAPRRLKEALNY